MTSETPGRRRVERKRGDETVIYGGRLTRVGPSEFAPEAFTWRWDRPGDHPVELDIAVEGGVATVETIRVEREGGRDGLRAADMRRLPLGSLLERALQLATWQVNARGGLAPVPSDLKVTRRRQLVTDERLQDVAEAYRRLDGDVEDLRREFSVSRPSMYRLISQARDRDLLPRKES